VLSPQVEYAFKHPLTQEVAYRTQLADRRAATHAAVARAIAEVDERLDEQAATLGYHWEAAGELLEAARWHRRAAIWAGTSDPVPGFAHWRRVYELVREVPDRAARLPLECEACVQVLNLGWRLGIPDDEAAELARDGERLATETRNRSMLQDVLTVQAGALLQRGDLEGAYGLMRRRLIPCTSSSSGAV
jgi:adenylate cyclase